MNRKTLFWVQLAIFTAIEILFCFTVLGSIPISPGIVMTLSHVPALLVALTLGKKTGAFIGLIMGLSSLIIWSFMPPNPAVAFAFSPFVPNGNIWSLLICIVPRVLFPVVAAFLFEKLEKRTGIVPAAVIAAVLGTFVHSLLVLSGIFLAFYNNPVVGGDYVAFIVAWGGLRKAGATRKAF